jgi:LytS/YehU family sensor histidine kinase
MRSCHANEACLEALRGALLSGHWLGAPVGLMRGLTRQALFGFTE